MKTVPHRPGSPTMSRRSAPWMTAAHRCPRALPVRGSDWAPGRDTGLSPQTGGPVNASIHRSARASGTFFWGRVSAAYVSGVAALVRAKFPNRQPIKSSTDLCRHSQSAPWGRQRGRLRRCRSSGCADIRRAGRGTTGPRCLRPDCHTGRPHRRRPTTEPAPSQWLSLIVTAVLLLTAAIRRARRPR